MTSIAVLSSGSKTACFQQSEQMGNLSGRDVVQVRSGFGEKEVEAGVGPGMFDGLKHLPEIALAFAAAVATLAAALAVGFATASLSQAFVAGGITLGVVGGIFAIGLHCLSA